MPLFGKKTTFLAPVPSPTQLHLCIAMTEPQEEPEIVVMVNISTVYNKPHEDRTVILQPGDHEFIKHESYVAYEYAKRVRVSILETRHKKAQLTIKDEISDELFEKILDGLFRSSRTPGDIKALCRRST